MINNLLTEAKRAASILNIECPEIRIVEYAATERRNPVVQESENWIVELCSEWDEQKKLSMLLRSLRIIWQKMHQYMDWLGYDCICFEAGYRVHIRREADMSFVCADEAINVEVREYILKLEESRALYGSDAERNSWLKRIWKGLEY